MGLLIAFGFVSWQVFLRPHAVNSANPQEASRARSVLPLDSFTVNLADPEEGRFLRVTMSLGVDGELPISAKGGNKASEAAQVSMANIRDTILTVLAQCRPDELLTPEGKAKLKADLLNSLNRNVPALGAREVYFTDFLVQR